MLPRRSFACNRKIIPVVMIALALAGAASRAADKDGFVDAFDVKPESFSSVGHNDYFILEPGYVLTYEGKENGKPGKLVITVTNETKLVDGVKTRVVEEREWSDGKLAEVSRNFFAIDQSTDDGYYFGEEVDEYKDGKLSGHGG